MSEFVIEYPSGSKHVDRAIFASSIGRSGTRYLSNLFTHCTNVPAWHLAEPYCHNQIMVDVNEGLPREEIIEKSKIIQGIIMERGCYFEATPVFTRVLAGTFLQVFPAISLIHLLRDPMEVARSYVNRKSFPGSPDRPWRLPLNLKLALFDFPQPLTPFQKNLCDWLENEMRYLELEPRLESTTDFHFANFGSANHICELFEKLDVPYRAADVIAHTKKQDLDRNMNRRKTRVSRKDLAESNELLERLRNHRFPGFLFELDCYQKFEFTRQIAEI